MSGIVEIIDRDGRRRRARPGEVLADGERFALPMQFMDHAAYGFRSRVSGGSVDYTDPPKPGPRFLDVGDAARLAADAAYEQMRVRLDTCRKGRQDPDRDHGSRPLTLDELEQAAATAYANRSERMRNAWRRP